MLLLLMAHGSTASSMDLAQVEIELTSLRVLGLCDARLALYMVRREISLTSKDECSVSGERWGKTVVSEN
jgi:hypothetical protein